MPWKDKQKKKKYLLKNKQKIKEQRKQYYLNNKEKEKKRKRKYYLSNKEKINEQQRQYYSNNKEKKKQYRLNNKERIKQYKKSEHGYFVDLWNRIKKRKHGNKFKNFEEFFNCWLKQKQTYGTKCPYLNIEMTRDVGNYTIHNKKLCPTNISVDRINTSLPYSPENLMFCSWEANHKKGSITPIIAKKYLDFYKERFGNKNEMESII